VLPAGPWQAEATRTVAYLGGPEGEVFLALRAVGPEGRQHFADFVRMIQQLPELLAALSLTRTAIDGGPCEPAREAIRALLDPIGPW
jgi:hypothetical protein